MDVLILISTHIPLLPVLVGLVLVFLPKLSPGHSARVATMGSLITCMVIWVLAFWVGSVGRLEAGWITFDRLNILMAAVIASISMVVHGFSLNYMQAEREYKAYFIALTWLVSALLLFVSANHVVLFGAAWVAMSVTMGQLLRFQKNWEPAKRASKLALNTFLLGDGLFVTGLVCLCLEGHSLELSTLMTTLTQQASSPLEVLGLLFIALAALTKSANIPFFTWLPNTMTAPTPVSALMHAGFVNSGGFLLSLLSPLYSRHPELLLGLFWVGGLTALLGVLAMLVQTDIKRYLAFSTIGQMGFMIMQCGLGAFPAAMIHIVTHGLLKASLFLGSGSTIQLAQQLSVKQLSTRLPAIGLTGAFSAVIITIAWKLELLSLAQLDDWLKVFTLLTALSIGLLSTRASKLPWGLTLIQGMTLSLFVVGMYVILEGAAYHWLFPTTRHAGLPLHTGQITIMALLWIASLTVVNSPKRLTHLHYRLYVWLLNTSQLPHTFTVRSTKNLTEGDY